ncbi:hypothetical protein CHS0354_000700 [Potamilus streckersoni]|uniref:Uncharacterized protein n=1 Tax=Potamilus streckersoni TaxID=2493646 RepID=A0AAE0T764_9BIVA|nr:hypothetical protein CHS0354_000700 [Potamilus streckersoni]
MKKKEHILRELEQWVNNFGYSVRYEKGSFTGGDCRVHEDKILLVNKFLPIEGRIATIAKAIERLDFKDNLSQKLKNRTRLKRLVLVPLLLALTFFAGECAAPTPIKFTITINANGGTDGATTTIEVESGKTATAPVSLPTRTSYVLFGWNTKADGSGTAFVFGTTIITADITIYAQWLEIATNINGTSYSHRGLAASSTHSYTVKACNTGGCSEASAAMSATTLTQVTAFELAKGDGTRDRYGAFKIAATATLNNYRLAVREASAAKPTAAEMEAGYHFKRNISSTPKYLIIANRLDKTNVPLFTWVEAGKSTDSLGTNMLLISKGLYDNTATGDNRFIEKSLLKPSTKYVLYGMEENGNAVAELLPFTTDNTQADITSTKSRLTDKSLNDVSFSIRKDEHLIIPLQSKVISTELSRLNGIKYQYIGDLQGIIFVINNNLPAHAFGGSAYTSGELWLWTGVNTANSDLLFKNTFFYLPKNSGAIYLNSDSKSFAMDQIL